MKDTAKVSRRDWFRLRVNKSARSLGESDANGPATGLKPIEHPPNHDGLDLSELPPMREAELSVDDVKSLFADVEQFASDIQLTQQSNNRSRTSGQIDQDRDRLKIAKEALLSGAVNRLQIRYRWQNALWIDTLEDRPAGYRLVRIRHA